VRALMGEKLEFSEDFKDEVAILRKTVKSHSENGMMAHSGGEERAGRVIIL